MSQSDEEYWLSVLNKPNVDQSNTPLRSPVRVRRTTDPSKWVPGIVIHESLKRLPPRQAEILMRISSGVSQRTIAQAMKMAESLLSIEKHAAMKKLGLASHVSLVRFFIENGIL